VVSLGKLTGDHVDYYEREIAGGAEDYYAMRGEVPGEWIGGGADMLGLDGTVTGGQLRDLIEGRDPATGAALRSRAIDVTGWDVTFSPPKSVSVLHAAGDPRLAAETMVAHRAAVRSAVNYLESEACWTRRGPAGARRLVGEGFVGVEYVHRLSRAGDAQLHSHVILANTTRAEGRWTTLDARPLFAHLKAASALYHAELRLEMTRRLGVEWDPIAPGKLAAEVTGVPRAVLRDQSRRRREIVERMEDRGESSPAAAQAAALDTRKAKDYAVDDHDIARELRERIADKGLGPAELTRVIDRHQPERATDDELAGISRRLLGPAGITEYRSTFLRRDAIQQWATAHAHGESAARIVQLADGWLAQDEIVALEPSPAATRQAAAQSARTRAPRRGELRYSTRTLIATEQTLLNCVAARRDAGVAIVPPPIVKRALAAHPTLSPEQAELVWRLTTSGHGIENVEAGAGAGKTYALGVLAEAFTAAGHQVVGTSTANLATRTLEHEAGVPALNTTRLLADLDRGETLAPGTVVLVDEAGMVGTRKYQRLAEHVTAANGKLIGIGDSRQLAEIEAGGAFRAISERFDAVELPGNRRQVDPEEIRALAALRDGDIDAYVLFQHERGRLTVADSPPDAIKAQLADWWQASQDYPDQESVLVALRRASVAELNANAHVLMRDGGRLGDDEITANDCAFAIGERVLLLRNNQSIDVDNGDRGIIVDLDVDRRSLTVELDAGRDVRLPAWYVDAGYVDYGYALTAHKLQSTTVDRTFALATDELYQEAGYSVATRARHETHFYLAAQLEPPEHEEAHGPSRAPDDPLARFTDRLTESRATTLAIDEPARAWAAELPTVDLREERDRLQQELNGFPARQAAELEYLEHHAAETREQLADIEQQIGRANHELDGLGFLKRRGSEGDELRSELRWLHTRHESFAQGQTDTLDSIDAIRRENDPVAWVEHHSDQIRDLRAVEHEIGARDRHAEHQSVVAARIDPPEYITAVLGSRPEDLTKRHAWDRGVAAIERYRHRHDISPEHDVSALGPDRSGDRNHDTSLDFSRAETAIRDARSELGLDVESPQHDRALLPGRISEPPERDLGRGHGLSIDL
jgi:conjugative relaxase-like TrwC/TraI family protein